MHPKTVYFIGAGPGDPDLITVKGRDIIRRADLVLYAGSLVPRRVVEQASERAEVADSSSMTLEQTHERMLQTVRRSGTVARVHTGDPSLFGAVQEQIRLLERDGIDYRIVPGVTAAFAAAAEAGVSFTLPEKTQSLILTRLAGRTPVPEQENLEELARHGSALALYLSASRAAEIQDKLLQGGYPAETPIVAAYRIGWPEQRLLRCRLSELATQVEAAELRRQTVFLVLPGQDEDTAASKLYSPDFDHGYRSRTDSSGQTHD
jgi:precorrin-4/cobalt-precorrin-4 C11-methyltransferase